MRITYYRFPEGVEESVMLDNGCKVVLKDGTETYAEVVPGDYRKYIKYIDDTITCSITTAKQLMKKYGGNAWTEHYDRDGSLFEATKISLNKNNSKHAYNHHL